MFTKSLSAIAVALALCLVSSISVADTVSLVENTGLRVRSDAVSGNSEGSTADLLGAVFSSRNHGAVLVYDLSSIPNSASITAVSLSFQTTGVDANSSTDISDGTANINLFEYAVEPDTVNGWNYNTQSFGPDMTGGTADDVAWTNPGGDFTNGNTPLSTILDSSFGAPNTVPVGTVFTFASSTELVSAIQSNLGDDEIRFQAIMNGLDGAGFSARHFLRTGSQTGDGGADLTPDWTLTVSYSIPEPSSASIVAVCALAVFRRRR